MLSNKQDPYSRSRALTSTSLTDRLSQTAIRRVHSRRRPTTVSTRGGSRTTLSTSSLPCRKIGTRRIASNTARRHASTQSCRRRRLVISNRCRCSRKSRNWPPSSRQSKCRARGWRHVLPQRRRIGNLAPSWRRRLALTCLRSSKPSLPIVLRSSAREPQTSCTAETCHLAVWSRPK